MIALHTWPDDCAPKSRCIGRNSDLVDLCWHPVSCPLQSTKSRSAFTLLVLKNLVRCKAGMEKPGCTHKQTPCSLPGYCMEFKLLRAAHIHMGLFKTHAQYLCDYYCSCRGIIFCHGMAFLRPQEPGAKLFADDSRSGSHLHGYPAIAPFICVPGW